jgi:hypothetical protein
MFGASAAAKTAQTGATGMADTSWMDAAPTDGSSVARTKFAEYMKMTPAEKMHAAMLQRHGVTEEEFKAMSADERAAIEAKIKEMIKAEVESGSQKGKTGVFADMKV